MLASQIPAKFPITFASAAGPSYTRPIPQASQIGIQPGAASLTDGFPPVTFSPVGAGGTPPFGQDFNGLLNQITAWNQWQQAGTPVVYDSAFSTAIGGYPKGAILTQLSGSGLWQSTVDNNTSNPDTGGANWIPFTSTTTQTDGCTRLVVTSTTVLTLNQYNGQYIIINGLPQIIPSGGVTITNSGLSASTGYNVFVYMNSGVMTLDISATNYVTNALGQLVKSGDATRRFIGKIYTNGSAQFQDDVTFRGCLNYFNRRVLPIQGNSGTAGTSTGSYVAISAQVNIINWGDEAVYLQVLGTGNGDAGIPYSVAVGVDGVTAGNSPSNYSASTGQNGPAIGTLAGNVSEGHHVIQGYGGTGTAGHIANFTISIVGYIQG